MSTVRVNLGLLGLLALGWAQSYRCDTIRLAVAGQWYYHQDTIPLQGGLPTVFPRWVHGGQPDSTSYTWSWWIYRLPSGAYVNSGSLTGYQPSLSAALPASAITAYPSFFELWIVGHRYRYGGYACMDSARFVMRVDSPPPSSLPPRCRPDSFFLQIGGRGVAYGHTVSLPLGSYSFGLRPVDIVYYWELRGPSGFQSSGSPGRNPIGTLHLTVPGRHVLRIVHYYATCMVDTLIYYLNATSSPFGSCSTFVGRGCAPSLVINGASYLPNRLITLVNGTHTFQLQPPTLLPSGASYNLSWTWSCPTAPGGYMSGWGGSQNGIPPFAGIVWGNSVCTLRVITNVHWLCPITQVCQDTSVFYIRGGATGNDTIVVTPPRDTTQYTPGDTIPLPIDTVCLHTGVITPYPDSVYWWWWYYYGPNGNPLDSGITPVVCVYPANGPGIYTLTYNPQSVPAGGRVAGQPQSFYLRFGARSTALGSPTGLPPKVYPTPTPGPVWLSLPQPGLHEVYVRDMLGRLLMQQRLEGDRVHYLPLQLSPGMYLLEVRQGPSQTVLRLLVQ